MKNLEIHIFKYISPSLLTPPARYWYEILTGRVHLDLTGRTLSGGAVECDQSAAYPSELVVSIPADQQPLVLISEAEESIGAMRFVGRRRFKT